MSNPLELLNIDVWQLIIRSLAPKDVFALTLVNKSLNTTLSCNEIWSSIVRSRWFAVGGMDPSVPVENYYSLYKDILRMEARADSVMNDMIQEGVNPSILQYGGTFLIMEAGEVLIPMLKALRNDLTIDLRKRWVASSVLDSLRSKYFLRYYKGLREIDPIDEESFFKLSFLDPAFDNLLPYRQIFLDGMVNRIRSNNDFTCEKSSTEKIKIITSAYEAQFKAVRHNYHQIRRNLGYKISEYHPSQQYVEDLSILRLYAGEIHGDQTAILAIIAKVAAQFGVSTSLAWTILTIEDPKNGTTFLTFGLRSFMFYSIESLMGVYRGTGVAMKALLKPFDVSSFRSLVKTRDIYSPLYHGAFREVQGSQKYYSLYPISKTHSRTSKFSLAKIYSDQKRLLRTLGSPSDSDIQKILQDSPFMGVILFGDDLESCPELIDLKEYFESMVFDSMFNPALSEWVSTKGYNTPHIPIGSVVWHPRRDFFGVIIHYKKGEDGGDNCYQIFPQHYTATQATIEVLKPVPKEVLETILEDFSIGRFFSHFDHETNRFIPIPNFSRNSLQIEV